MFLENLISDIARVEKRKVTIPIIIKWYIIDVGVRAVILYRLSNFFYKKKFALIAQLIKNYNIRVTGAEIAQNCVIGPGLFIAHPNGIVIGGKARIGNNLSLHQQVTIGLANPKEIKNPKIGNGVYVGCGAKILGDIKIGNNCIIGANSVVNKNFGDGNLIVGIPAKVLNKVEKGD